MLTSLILRNRSLKNILIVVPRWSLGELQRYITLRAMGIRLLKSFLSLDLGIIAFLRELVIKTLMLKRRTFTLTRAILFKISRKTAWKVE